MLTGSLTGPFWQRPTKATTPAGATSMAAAEYWASWAASLYGNTPLRSARDRTPTPSGPDTRCSVTVVLPRRLGGVLCLASLLFGRRPGSLILLARDLRQHDFQPLGQCRHIGT